MPTVPQLPEQSAPRSELPAVQLGISWPRAGKHSARVLIASVPGSSYALAASICCICNLLSVASVILLILCLLVCGENTMKACCYVLCIIGLLNIASSFDKAKKLHEEILVESGYNKVIRPVINPSDHINVSLGLKLSQLIDVVSSHLWY